jgi:niacin transporter
MVEFQKVGRKPTLSLAVVFRNNTTKVCALWAAFVVFLFYEYILEVFMRSSSTRRIVFTGLCIALGVVLPLALHSVPNAGSIFLPMHIPVLLCGLACGWAYGLSCGVVVPLLSSLLTGMPPAAFLPAMLCELAVYGVVAGIMSRVINLRNKTLGIYIQLITAMLAGRVVYGILNALIFAAGQYSFSVWLTGVFVTSLPGIVIQLVFIPIVIIALKKAKLLEDRAAEA